MNQLWKTFRIKHDSEMTRNKYGHHEDAIPSDNEGKNNLVHSSSYHSSKKSCARTNRNQIIMEILPTDDPT